MKKSLVWIPCYVGIFLMTVGLILLIAHPSVVWGKELLLYVCMWIGLNFGFIVSPALRIFVMKDEALRKHMRVFVVSWIYLGVGAVASVAYMVLFPNWEVWTRFPIQPSLSHPVTFLVAAFAPVYVLNYNLIFFPEGRDEIEEWKAKRKTSKPH